MELRKCYMCSVSYILALAMIPRCKGNYDTQLGLEEARANERDKSYDERDIKNEIEGRSDIDPGYRYSPQYISSVTMRRLEKKIKPPRHGKIVGRLPIKGYTANFDLYTPRYLPPVTVTRRRKKHTQPTDSWKVIKTLPARYYTVGKLNRQSASYEDNSPRNPPSFTVTRPRKKHPQPSDYWKEIKTLPGTTRYHKVEKSNRPSASYEVDSPRYPLPVTVTRRRKKYTYPTEYRQTLETQTTKYYKEEQSNHTFASYEVSSPRYPSPVTVTRRRKKYTYPTEYWQTNETKPGTAKYTKEEQSNRPSASYELNSPSNPSPVAVVKQKKHSYPTDYLQTTETQPSAPSKVYTMPYVTIIKKRLTTANFWEGLEPVPLPTWFPKLISRPRGYPIYAYPTKGGKPKLTNNKNAKISSSLIVNTFPPTTKSKPTNKKYGKMSTSSLFGNIFRPTAKRYPMGKYIMLHELPRDDKEAIDADAPPVSTEDDAFPNSIDVDPTSLPKEEDPDPDEDAVDSNEASKVSRVTRCTTSKPLPKLNPMFILKEIDVNGIVPLAEGNPDSKSSKKIKPNFQNLQKYRAPDLVEPPQNYVDDEK